MDSVLFLIAVVLLRFVWRFIERAATQQTQDDPERKRPRRTRPVPQAGTERATATSPTATSPTATSPTATSPTATRPRSRQRAARPRPLRSGETATRLPQGGDLLERLRQAVEEAAGVGAEPEPLPAPPPRPTTPWMSPLPDPVEASDAALPSSAMAVVTPPTTTRHEAPRLREVRMMLQHRTTLRDALLLREILGPPVARRRGAPPLHAG